MQWLAFSLIATALWASSNVIDKIALSQYIKKPIFCVSMAGFLGFVFAIIETLSLKVQIIATLPLFLSLIEGIIYIGALLFYFKALSIEEVTRITPILQTIPLITLFLSTIFLNEILRIVQYVGIVLIIIGALLVSLKKSNNNIFTFNKAFWFILFSCLLFSISWVLSKYILNSISYSNLFFWSRIGGFLIVCCLLIVVPSYNKLTLNIKEISGKSFGLVAISEVINLIALFVMTIALSKGPASIVSAITSSQPLFVLTYAFLLSHSMPKTFKSEIEKTNLIVKVVASAFIITGFFLIGET